MTDDTTRRKDAHLELCASGDVQPAENSTLFEEFHLVHEALPELAASEIDPSTEFLGKRLRLPLMITGMSGGTERSGRLNRGLAVIAERMGIAFGVGSQRAMLADPSTAPSFQVRAVAPNVLLVGNIGLAQARSLGVDGVRKLVDSIQADALALHLNAGQEMVQPEGDRDFRGGLDTIAALARALPDRLVVKETGCGLGPATVKRLIEAGVRHLDVSGLGGTSWTRVEALRSQGTARAVGLAFSGWGIPTAASVAAAARVSGGRARILASGGIRSGLDVAKAIALGADLAGAALPVFKAWQAGGDESAAGALGELADGLRLAMVLTGSRTLADLRGCRKVIGPALGTWIGALVQGGP